MKTGKSICVAVALTMFTIGCTIENPDGVKSQTEKQITISAYRADFPETKTQRDESDGSVLWTPDDAISLFYGSGTNGGNRFVSTGTEVSRVTNFTGTIGVITGGADVSVEDTYFWGLYPYDATAVCDGSSIVTTLPSQQEAVPSTFATNLFPSVGRAQGLSMGFYNICGGVRFTVTKEGLKSVTLKAIGGEALTGKARIGFENGVPKVLEITDGSDEITLTAPDGKFLEVGKYYYFITFPQSLSQGIRMKFETFTEEGTYERQTSSLTIKRSIFGTLNNVDQNVVYAKKTGNIPIEDPSFKTWLVQHGYDHNSDGEISYTEADVIENLYIGYSDDYNIVSLRGIEYMPNLLHLNCSGTWSDTGVKEAVSKEYYYIGPYANNWSDTWGPLGTLRYVDVTANHKLKTLDLSNNSGLGENIETIDLSHNPDIEYLYLGMTYMYYPDITSCTKLKSIEIHHLRGGVVPDLSNKPLLENLSMDWPQEKQYERSYDIDVSGCPLLNRLHVGNAARSISDLSNNPLLKEVYIWNYKSPLVGLGSLGDIESLTICESDITEIDTQSMSNLVYLQINRNSISSLNLSGNTLLEDLSCDWNSITSLDLSNNLKLKRLNCIENNISSLILPDSMESIMCWNNPLGSIDVSSMPELIDLACANTGLTSLDVTHNPKLLRLAFNDNNIPTINLSANPLLEELAVWNCGLTALDLTKNPKLTWVRCWGNRIETLDVSKNPFLGTRHAQSKYDNGLWCVQQADAQGHNYLKTLYIAEGQQIPYITVNRSSEAIPAETAITVSPSNGGGEGTGNDNWN